MVNNKISLPTLTNKRKISKPKSVKKVTEKS